MRRAIRSAIRGQVAGLCRRLHCQLLRMRIAQLRLVASAMPCSTAGDAMYQANLLGQAAVARHRLTRLEQWA